VVDEAQDFPPEAIRSLAKAVPREGSLTLFADYAQQTPGPRTSWRGCGLAVGSTEVFQHNYRNTQEIARLAIGIAAMPHFKDSVDLVDPQVPPVAAATKPTLVRYRSVPEEVTAVVAAVTVPRVVPARIGVLTRTDAQARKVARDINDAQMLNGSLDRWGTGSGIYAGTYQAAKGLEFDVVFMPFCGQDQWPDQGAVGAVGHQEAVARDSRLLYVGVTRAREELVITHTGEPTNLLPAVDSGLYQVVAA
jgi:superfamily I DNA/RNA helicase